MAGTTDQLQQSMTLGIYNNDFYFKNNPYHSFTHAHMKKVTTFMF